MKSGINVIFRNKFEDIQRHIAGMPLGPMAPSLGVVFETEKKCHNEQFRVMRYDEKSAGQIKITGFP